MSRCFTANCTAVGNYDFRTPATPNVAHTRPLVEHWNGAKWTIVATPVPHNATNWSFTGLTCSDSRYCFAVGWYQTSSGKHLLLEYFNGQRWNVVTIPNPRGATFNSVSCAPNSALFRGRQLGGREDEDVHRRLGPVPLEGDPEPDPHFRQDGIADCGVVPGRERLHRGRQQPRAVGGLVPYADPALERHRLEDSAESEPRQSAHAQQRLLLEHEELHRGRELRRDLPRVRNREPLIEQWDGTVWKLVLGAVPTGATSTFLNSVTCVKAAECFSVGGQNGPPGTLHTLVEQRH